MKGQISMETIFTIGTLLIIFIGTSLFVFTKRFEIRETENYIDLKNECYKVANAIDSVGFNGPGTKARIRTDYLVRTINNNTISIEGIENMTVFENKIAILASISGVTKQTFYDAATSKFNPTWYSNCDESIEFLANWRENECTSHPPYTSDPELIGAVDFLIIPDGNNYTKLVKDINQYNTIYLEDAHISPIQEINGINTTDIIRNWVIDGGVIILSEHVLCANHWWNTPMCPRHNGTGSPPYTWVDFYQNAMRLGFNVFIDSAPGDIEFLISDPYFPNLPAGTIRTMEEGIVWSESYLGDPEVKNFVRVARPVANPTKDSISYWDYGAGRVIYLVDFETTNSADLFEEDLINMIETAYLELVMTKAASQVICKLQLPIDRDFKVTGKLELENINNKVVIKNYV